VCSSGDGATDTFFRANGPVLLEGSGAYDRRLVDTSAREYLVGALVESEIPF